jgi:glycerol-3-phosphate O-acyltransferase/dihydroxyacetone phosphate acyltransferase
VGGPRYDVGTVATWSGGYRLVRLFIRLLLGLFYREIVVVDADRVPREGALIVAANHHNSVVDAMLLLAVIPRRLRTLAKAALFRHPLIGPFLHAIGALPVHRRQEGGEDPARNAELFRATTATLRAGGGILIFPEGRTQPEPVLLKVHTGAARMVLAAGAEAPAAGPVTLLPVGLVFHKPGQFRTGSALVLIGPPVPTVDCLAVARSAPERAVRTLTERLTAALRRQIVEADDRQTLDLLGLVEAVWREEARVAPASPSARVEWLQRVMRAYRDLRDREPERVAAFRRQLEAYAQDLEQSGLAGDQLPRAYPRGVVAGFALREGLLLLLGAPLAVGGDRGSWPSLRTDGSDRGAAPTDRGGRGHGQARGGPVPLPARLGRRGLGRVPARRRLGAGRLPRGLAPERVRGPRLA